MSQRVAAQAAILAAGVNFTLSAFVANAYHDKVKHQGSQPLFRAAAVLPKNSSGHALSGANPNNRNRHRQAAG
jgi:hypothetical protein